MLAGSMSEEEVDLVPAKQNLFNNNLLAGLSFLLFYIFNAPCLVAIATAFREQGNVKWGFYVPNACRLYSSDVHL